MIILGQVRDDIYGRPLGGIMCESVCVDYSEWHTGVKDRAVLQDEDITTKTDGPFRRLNTIGYYRVPDGATVSLIPHQRSLYSINSSTSNNKSSSISTHKYGTYYVINLQNPNPVDGN